jgi:outer membrane receptor for ferrienterochelin and colicins
VVRGGGNKFDLPPHQADTTEQIEYFINGGGLVYMLSATNNYSENMLNLEKIC